MVKLRNLKIFFILLEIVLGISASTHWIVTENGRIQSHLDSPFHLRRPYDLLGLLDQETRLAKIDTLYQDLVSRKQLIDKKWSGLEGATDLENRIYTQDPDCLRAGKILSEIDLYTSIASDGSDREGITISDFLIDDITPDGTVVPDCKSAIELDFSMFVFEHLSGMVNRMNITIYPEVALEQWLQPGTTVATFGHQVALGLVRNNTSWLHYNLGAIYWRIKGEAPKAVECGRRAVHFAPREYRDIALLNLASIFHQARYPGEAAIILHAAVDHAPHQPANHFALGNVYAVLSDYNRSVACFDNFLKLRPGLQEAITSKFATICHRKLEKGLLDLHESLQGILSELNEYHNQQETWLRLQERLIWEQAPLEAKLVSYNPETFNAILMNRGQSCMQRSGEDGKASVLSCDLNSDSQLMAHNLQIDLTLSLQMLLRNVEAQAQKISEQMVRGRRYVNSKIVLPRSNKKDPIIRPQFVKNDENGDINNNNINNNNLNINNINKNEHVVINKVDELVSNLKRSEKKYSDSASGFSDSEPLGMLKYPPDMIISKNSAYFDIPGWPGKHLCAQWKLYKDLGKDHIMPVFLPPENKGFDVTKMLSDDIGLPAGKEHELPWYPPVCQQLDNGDIGVRIGGNSGGNSDKQTVFDKKYFPASLLRNGVNSVQLSPETYSYLQMVLLNYVNQGKVSEAEIGQRIITAIQKKAGASWLLATLASLYWRVRTNTKNSIECLNIAIRTVPDAYKDVVLVSIGSMLYELGYVHDALKIALEAFAINKVEPATNLLLAMLYNLKDKSVIASYHMKQTLRVEPDIYNDQADLMLRTWSCSARMLHHIQQQHILEGSATAGINLGLKMDGKENNGMCAERETLNTEGVICSAGGEQCKAAAIQCYRAETVPDDSAEFQSISKLFSNDHCNQRKVGLGHSLISTLLAANNAGSGGNIPNGGGGGASAGTTTGGGSDSSSATSSGNGIRYNSDTVASILEGSGNLEPDQSQLESLSMDGGHQQAFHMRISLGDENAAISASTLGDFYVSVSLTDGPTPEAMLYVYDKSGTYPLSPKNCRAIKDADWLHFSSMWQSIATRNMDIGQYLKPLAPDQEPLKPHCDMSLPPSPTTLDHLGAMRLRYHRSQQPTPEPSLAEWLGLMAGDQSASLHDLGTRIALALQENNTSWILATAAALYWRTVGHTDQAVTCLRQALTYAPADSRDIPLSNLANVLFRVGFHGDALEVAYMALDTRPNFVVNHFTVGNIHTSLGDLEKAISFYRSSLALDANFEPARNRLQAILCTLLFDETGSLRDANDN